MAYGYQALQGALDADAQQTIGVLLIVALGKILTTSLTIGSGGSGGVFGPSMVIGGCAGGALGLLFHQWAPALVPHPASYVVVGMAGFFAAAAKTPFSTVLIVSEMTGGYSLLLPSLWVCVLAFMLSDEKSIYSSQLEGRSFSPAHQGAHVRQLLSSVMVRELLPASENSFPRLRDHDKLERLYELLEDSQRSLLPVVDADMQLLGVVTLDEAFIAAQAPDLSPLVVVQDLLRSDIKPLALNDSLDSALERFVEADVLDLPVIDSRQSRRLVGLLRRTDVTLRYIKRLHEPKPVPARAV
jgi:chloride channel protein, CIC family